MLLNDPTLYAITPSIDSTSSLISYVQQLWRGGCRLFQYRHPEASPSLRYMQAKAMSDQILTGGGILIINDDIPLAQAIDASGVHLGKDDVDIFSAREQLGNDKIIGSSCYNSIAWALSAQRAGADYYAFGACYPSHTKQNAPLISHSIFETAKKHRLAPIVSIGGITLTNIPSLRESGASIIAVISDLFSCSNREEQTRAYLSAIQGRANQ